MPAGRLHPGRLDRVRELGAACSGGSTADGRTWEHCTGGPSPVMQVVWIAAAVILALMPIATAFYLHHRATRPPRAALALGRA